MKHYQQCAMITALWLTLGTAAVAQDAPYAENLTGDWGGARSTLADKGLEIGLSYTGDMWAVVGGGRKRETTMHGLGELRLDLDGEKLYGVKGNTMSFAVIHNSGAQPNGSNVGSTQGISNTEVAANGVRLYEAWMNQEFFDGRLAVLFGVHDLNSEFAATPMSDNFLKPTMQIGQSFAQSGQNGPAIYPTPALAGRVRVVPTEHSYIAAAVYDGVAGDPDHPRTNPIDLGDKDGALVVAEVGYAPTEANKLALGYWEYTAGLDDQLAVDGFGDPVQSDAYGAYLLASYRFYEDAASGRSAGAFWRGGLADGDTAQVKWEYTAGVVGNGWIAARPAGEFGLGISHARNSDSYMAAQAAAATASDRNEYSYELYYRDTIARGVNIQPDIQYVVNPGTDVVTDNATVIGLRVDVSF